MSLHRCLHCHAPCLSVRLHLQLHQCFSLHQWHSLGQSLMSTFTAWDNLPSYNMVCWIVLHFYAKCIIILTIVFVFLDKKSFKWKGITTTIFGSSRSNNSGQIRLYYLGTSKWCWSDWVLSHAQSCFCFVMREYNIWFLSNYYRFWMPAFQLSYCWLNGNVFPVFCVEPFIYLFFGVRKCA